MKTYIVNLKTAHERRQSVLDELAKYPFLDAEIVEAVDGRLLSEEERNRQFDCDRFEWRYKRRLQAGELGCTLSHRLCYQKLLDSKEEVALIVEDDVRFLSEEQVEDVIVAGGRLIAHKEACMVLLEPNTVHYVLGNCLTGKYHYYRVNQAMCTFAYLINRKTAARILSKQRPSTVADDYVFYQRKGIQVFVVLPAIAWVRNLPSQINENGDLILCSKQRKRGIVWILYYYIRYLWFVKIEKVKMKLGWLKQTGYYESDLYTYE